MSSKTKIILFSALIGIIIFMILLNYVRSEIYSANGNPIKKIYVKNVLVKVEEVKSPKKIELGLAGRKSLNQGRGMLFLMPKIDFQRFWMKGMQFPIDIVWITNGRVIGCEKNIQPKDDRIFTSPAPAIYVLEVPEGFCDNNKVEVNDEVKI